MVAGIKTGSETICVQKYGIGNKSLVGCVYVVIMLFFFTFVFFKVCCCRYVYNFYRFHKADHGNKNFTKEEEFVGTYCPISFRYSSEMALRFTIFLY